jgi:hypothetical protein
LLNGDYNNTNRWTKACTLYALKFNKQSAVTKSIVAQMFNPDNLLSELAGSILIEEDKESFDSITERLLIKDETFKTNLDRIIHKTSIKFDICNFFAKGDAFNFLSGIHISEIVDKAELLELSNGEELIITDQQYAYFAYVGEQKVITKEGNESIFIENELFGNMFSDEKVSLHKIISKGDTKLFKINMNDIFDVLTNFKSHSNRILNTVSKNVQNHFYQYSKR